MLTVSRLPEAWYFYNKCKNTKEFKSVFQASRTFISLGHGEISPQFGPFGGPDVFVYPSLYSCDDGYLSFLLFIRECWVNWWILVDTRFHHLCMQCLDGCVRALCFLRMGLVRLLWVLVGARRGHFAFLLRPRRRVVLAVAYRWGLHFGWSARTMGHCLLSQRNRCVSHVWSNCVHFDHRDALGDVGGTCHQERRGIRSVAHSECMVSVHARLSCLLRLLLRLGSQLHLANVASAWWNWSWHVCDHG